jgi:hypothetical protein
MRATPHERTIRCMTETRTFHLAAKRIVAADSLDDFRFGRTRLQTARNQVAHTMVGLITARHRTTRVVARRGWSPMLPRRLSSDEPPPDRTPSLDDRPNSTEPQTSIHSPPAGRLRHRCWPPRCSGPSCTTPRLSSPPSSPRSGGTPRRGPPSAGRATRQALTHLGTEPCCEPSSHARSSPMSGRHPATPGGAAGPTRGSTSSLKSAPPTRAGRPCATSQCPSP